MRFLLIILLEVSMLSCFQRASTDAERLEWLHSNGMPDGRSAALAGVRSKRKLEERDIDLAHKEIKDALAKLVAVGRLTVYHPEMEYHVVARHLWFPTTRKVAEKRGSNWSGSDGRDNAEMGLYVFDPSLFDLAMKSWYTTEIRLQKGSPIIVAPRTVFTKDIVSYRTNIAAYGGDHNEAFVKRLIDEHSVELDRPSESDCESCSGQFVPPDTPRRYGLNQ